MITVLQYILGFAAFVLVLWLIKKFFDRLFHDYAQQLEKVIQALAKDYGLEIGRTEKVLDHTDWAPPFLSGKANGFETTISIVERGHGEDRDLFFRVEIAVQNPQRFHLELYRNAAVNRGLFGQTKFDLGDPNFQKRYIFRAAKPALLPKVLDEAIRAKALSIKNSLRLSQIRLRGNKIHFEQYAFYQKKQVKEFRNVLDLTLAIAAKVDQL